MKRFSKYIINFVLVGTCTFMFSACGAILHGLEYNSIQALMIVPSNTKVLFNGDTLNTDGSESIDNSNDEKISVFLPRGLSGQSLTLSSPAATVESPKLVKSLDRGILCMDLLMTFGTGLIWDFATANWYYYGFEETEK